MPDVLITTPLPTDATDLYRAIGAWTCCEGQLLNSAVAQPYNTGSQTWQHATPFWPFGSWFFPTNDLLVTTS